MIRYRNYKSSDLLSSARLVRDGSRRYFLKDIKTAEGRAFWKSLQSLRKENIPNQEKLFKSLSIKIVAMHGSRIIGLIAGKPNEVVMLFVSTPFQHKGIASELYLRFRKRALQKGSALLKVKSSRYAEKFYEKAGFHRTGAEKEINGLPAIPMEANIFPL